LLRQQALPNTMELLYSIIAGIAGTFLMTLFMDVVSLLTRYNFHVPVILGTMVTMETKPSGKVSDSLESKVWGYILHYAIGVLFAVLYQQIFSAGAAPISYLYAIAFGAIAGLVAMTFWYLFLRLHPLAPVVHLRLYLPFIFLGHLLFAIGMNITFTAMVQILGTITS
jgi:hypothetical protein